jgi:hypothetical protein
MISWQPRWRPDLHRDLCLSIWLGSHLSSSCGYDSTLLTEKLSCRRIEIRRVPPIVTVKIIYRGYHSPLGLLKRESGKQDRLHTDAYSQLRQPNQLPSFDLKGIANNLRLRRQERPCFNRGYVLTNTLLQAQTAQCLVQRSRKPTVEMSRPICP